MLDADDVLRMFAAIARPSVFVVVTLLFRACSMWLRVLLLLTRL